MEEIEKFNLEEAKQREKMALKREEREPPKPKAPPSKQINQPAQTTNKFSQPVIQNLSK